MLFSGYLKEHPRERWRLILAAGGRCENCSNRFPPLMLEIHRIGDPETAGRDLQKNILILCPSCRRSFLSGGVEESLQRALVRHRSRMVRKKMRGILGYHPPEYVPPGDFDPVVLFREMVNSGATDHCLNGG